MKKEQSVTLRVFNVVGRKITFVLEPWGEVYEFEPEGEFVVQFEGPIGGSPEVVVGPESVEVYGWTGSTARLYKGDTELGSSSVERRRVPQIP